MLLLLTMKLEWHYVYGLLVIYVIHISGGTASAFHCLGLFSQYEYLFINFNGIFQMVSI